jgi:hypothetical protein
VRVSSPSPDPSSDHVRVEGIGQDSCVQIFYWVVFAVDCRFLGFSYLKMSADYGG